MLVVAGTVTSTMRLLAVLPLLESDRRVQVVFTHDECSPSTLMAGVPELLETLQGKVIPWCDATRLKWDLVLTASEKDRVHQLDGPAVLLPHGAGFQKRDVVHGGVAGLSSKFLLGQWQTAPSAIALSHPEQRELLASSCPEALDRAVVVGDPCVEVLVANRHRRPRFRDVLGVGDRRLIVLSSTWGGESLLGRAPDLLEDLLAQLPFDAYQCCLLTHPGILAVHGQRQLRAWLSAAEAMGLMVVPTAQRWEPVLLGADCVISDQGSMSLYAAALDLPLIMGGGSPDTTVPGSPVAELAKRVPRLTQQVNRVREQVESAIAGHEPGQCSDLVERAFDKPDATAERLRRLLYQVLNLPEPPSPATFGLLPPPVVPRPTPTAFTVHGAVHGQRIALDRAAAPPVPPALPREAGRHLVAHGIDASQECLANAQVIYIDASVCHGRAEFGTWAESVWTQWPRAEIAAVVLDDRTCQIATPGGGMVEFGLDTAPDAGRVCGDPLLLASLAWILLTNDRHLDGQHLITVSGNGVPIVARGEILRQP